MYSVGARGNVCPCGASDFSSLGGAVVRCSDVGGAVARCNEVGGAVDRCSEVGGAVDRCSRSLQSIVAVARVLE